MRLTGSIGFDLTCIVCASLSGAIVALLYSLAIGWL